MGIRLKKLIGSVELIHRERQLANVPNLEREGGNIVLLEAKLSNCKYNNYDIVLCDDHNNFLDGNSTLCESNYFLGKNSTLCESNNFLGKNSTLCESNNFLGKISTLCESNNFLGEN